MSTSKSRPAVTELYIPHSGYVDCVFSLTPRYLPKFARDEVAAGGASRALLKLNWQVKSPRSGALLQQQIRTSDRKVRFLEPAVARRQRMSRWNDISLGDRVLGLAGLTRQSAPRKGMGTFRAGLVQHARGLGEPNPFSELLEFLKHFQEIGQDICPLQNSGRLSHRYTPPWPPDGEPHQGAHRQIFPCKRMNNLNQISGGMIAEPGQREAILCRGLRVIRDRRAIGLARPHRLSGCHRQRRQSAARYQTGGQHQASDRRSTLRDGRNGCRTQRPASHLAHLAEHDLHRSAVRVRGRVRRAEPGMPLSKRAASRSRVINYLGFGMRPS